MMTVTVELPDAPAGLMRNETLDCGRSVEWRLTPVPGRAAIVFRLRSRGQRVTQRNFGEQGEVTIRCEQFLDTMRHTHGGYPGIMDDGPAYPRAPHKTLEESEKILRLCQQHSRR